MNKKISLIMASAIATILIAYISSLGLSNQAFAQDFHNNNMLPQSPLQDHDALKPISQLDLMGAATITFPSHATHVSGPGTIEIVVPHPER